MVLDHARRCRAALGLTGALLLSTAVVGSPTATGMHGAVGVPQTYVGHTYTAQKPPTADKPQSKLWHHDGAWWALMVEHGGTRVTVHELMSDHTWRNTGSVVDSRPDNTGDALWSARDDRLYVASRAPGSGLEVAALTYDAAQRTWSSVTGFPRRVAEGNSESATIDQDSLGRLWVTYTRNSRVWVARSDANQGSWTAGFRPNVPDTVVSSDDISALIAFGTSVGVLYSDQQSGGFHFAIHDDADPDDAWRVENVNHITQLAEDHINLKQLVGDPEGRVFAAVKTSADTGGDPSDPLVGVLTRVPGAGGSGAWSFAPAGTVADDHTRPQIMIDASNQELYFFATAPVKGGDIYYKKSSLGDISFDVSGRGDPFIDATAWVNNVTTSKQPATSSTGLVALAVAHGKRQYVHAEMTLADGAADAPGDEPPPNPPPALTAVSPEAGAADVPLDSSVRATFSEPVQGVTTDTFTLLDPAGAQVPASLREDGAGEWVFDPDGDLAPATTYTATVTGGTSQIRDLQGEPLSPVTTSWSFTTAAVGSGDGDDGTPPAPREVSPEDGETAVPRWKSVKVTFTEAVAGVDESSFRLVDESTGGAVAAQLRRRSSTEHVLDPDEKLARDTWHRAELGAGIHDEAGTPLEATSWSFLTGPAPRVTYRVPKPDATGVSPSTTVSARFNEEVRGVDPTTFLLTDAGGTTVAGTVTKDATKEKYYLQPEDPLASQSTYTVTVLGGDTGIADLAGNELQTVTWTFTTR